MWIRLLTSGWTYAVLMSVAFLWSRLDYSHLENSIETQKTNHALALVARYEDVLETERSETKKYQDIAAQYEQDKQRLSNEKDAVIADLRSDALRLRRRFQCPSPSVPNTPDTTSERNGGEGGGLLDSDAEFLVRLAAEADERVMQLQACQAVLKETQGD